MPGKRANPTRVNCKWLMLTYSQTPDDFNPEKIADLAKQNSAKCLISKEYHKDGGTHYHALLYFEKRFQTRNVHHFDVQGRHPNWLTVRSTPERAWDYVGKEGEIMYQTLDRPAEGTQTKPAPNQWVWQSIATAKTEEEMRSLFMNYAPKEYILHFGNITKFAVQQYTEDDTQQYSSPQYNMGSNAPKELLTWLDGFKAGASTADGDSKFTVKERLALHSLIYLNA